MTFRAEGAVLGSVREKTAGGQHRPAHSSSQQQVEQPACGPFCVPHGVRIVQNTRPLLEDAFSHALIDGHSWPGAATAAAGCSSEGGAFKHNNQQQQQQQPLAFFGVYDGHGGAEVAQHAASKLHQHFQSAYRQLSTAAHLAGHVGGSGSAYSNSSSVEELLCQPWNSSSSTSSALTASSNGSSNPADSLADVLLLGGQTAVGPDDHAAAAAADLACSSPSSTSSSSQGGSPTAQDVWAAINAPSQATHPSSAALQSNCSSGGGLLASTGSKHHQRHHQHQQHPSKASRMVVKALREAFLRTDADLAGTEVGEVVGTTAVTAVMSAGQLFVAHCGDSRAVLCRKGMAVPLTSDHKPGRADEMARVSSLGGKVVYKGGSHRVMGLLAMSRALGDHFLRPYIIPEPEVLCLQRCPDDELLILATDGLWDVFSCQEATTLALRSTIRARQRGASASAACRVGASVLVRGAIERGSRDNITVAVVDLRHREENIASVASVLASQCSSDLTAFVAGGGGAGGAGNSRKRRSSSGNDDDDAGDFGQQQYPSQQQQQQLSASHSGGGARGGASAAAAGGVNTGAAAAGAPTNSASTSNRRHTSSTCEAGSGGSGSAMPVVSASTSGARGAGVTWGWSLQGLHILPHSQDNPTTSIRALAQAAAATVAAFSGAVTNRSTSGLPHQRAAVTTAGPAALSSAGAGLPGAGAAATQQASQTPPGVGLCSRVPVAAPATPTLADLLSMQSAPVRQGSSGFGSRGSSGGKPPLPQQRTGAGGGSGL